jgi:transcription antitermination factor NusB
MTGDEGMRKMIPPRMTVAELAHELDSPIEVVQEALEARDEPARPGDVVGAESAMQVAATLGHSVMVEARDQALEILYQIEVGGEGPETQTLGGRSGALVRGVLASREELDHEIESVSEHWSVARMPVLDRTILRIGLFELRNHPEIPTAVAVSEAVRLATVYSTEKSGAFVNGVLAALARGR